MKPLTRFSRAAAAMFVGLLLLTGSAFAQTAPTTTTLAAAMADASGQIMSITSATGWVASTVSAQQMALIDGRELVTVRAVNGTNVTITRGVGGSRATPHASGATVVTGVPAFFVNTDIKVAAAPGSSCTSTNEMYLPVYNYLNGRRWNCIGSIWMVDNGMSVLAPSSCVSSVSANSTGTNGLTTVGASVTPAMQAQTSATGTNTHTYVCNLNALTAGLPANTNRGISLIDAVFLYGVQTTALGTQAATLASGTLNSVIVFSSITYPAAGASETASTVTPVRADSGTLVITPVVASANVSTTTAGGFYSMKFTPAAAIPMQTDLKQYLLTVALLNTATSATITNSPGVIVHYAYVPD